MCRFGEHEVDIAGRELRRGGVAVHLEPHAFDLLDAVRGHRYVSEAVESIDELRRHGA